jgi:hypothetical protein
MCLNTLPFESCKLLHTAALDIALSVPLTAARITDCCRIRIKLLQAVKLTGVTRQGGSDVAQGDV